jgi:hypothetical protein
MKLWKRKRKERKIRVSLYLLCSIDLGCKAHTPNTTIILPLLTVRADPHKIFLALKLVSRIKVEGVADRVGRCKWTAMTEQSKCSLN